MKKPVFEEMFEHYHTKLNELSDVTARTLYSLYNVTWAYKGYVDYEPSDPYQKALETELDNLIDYLVENEAKSHEYFLKTVTEIKNRKRPE